MPIPTPAPVLDEDKPSEISEALRKEIVKIASAGDPKRNGAFTAEVAAKIKRVIHAGHALLLAEGISSRDMDELLRKKPKGNMGMMMDAAMESGYAGGDQADLGQLDELNVGAPLAFSSPQENFGTIAIRELVNTFKSIATSQNETPEKLINALAAARERGLEDVAKKIEEKLGIAKPMVGLASVTAFEKEKQ